MDYRKAHFIGIGGVGMSAVAKLLRDKGVTITGSDEEVYPPISDFLREQRFDIKTPYAAQNIPADADIIVIGKNAKLVPETNPEVAAAYASGKKILSFPEVLVELSKDKETIVVAGSYGKSTSTALLVHCLESAGLDPSFFIGAIPLTPSTSASIGSGPLFVLEGDEYPSSNTDPRSKFLHYHPSHLLITPLAHDHFNIFSTPEEYMRPFYELIQLPPEEATIVVCSEGPLSGEFLSHIKRSVITYGLLRGEFTAANIAWGERTSFDIVHNAASVAHIETTQLGEHNIQNIVGIAAFLLARNLVSTEQLSAAVASFKGIKRRLDRKSDKTTIPVFEGFGSSYEKARAAILAMKRHFPTRSLTIVFEPNTFSWRNRAALPQYDDVFSGAKGVYIFEPPHDGKDTQLSLQEIVERVGTTGVPTQGFEEPETLVKTLQKGLGSEDVILLLSSGAFGGLNQSIPAMAEQKFPR